MKKFLTKLILAAACTTALATCLVGCGGNGAGGLKFNSKYYVDASGATEERSYYTFDKNGTGEYYYYYFSSYSSYIDNYSISFKYTYTNADKTQIACFYDSVKYTGSDTRKNVSSYWRCVLNVSENVLTSTGQGGEYVEAVNEEYLKQIPNYGKNTD